MGGFGHFFVAWYLPTKGYVYGWGQASLDKISAENWAWWCIPLIPALKRLRQADLCEFEASLVYRMSSRIARATQRNQVSGEKIPAEQA